MITRWQRNLVLQENTTKEQHNTNETGAQQGTTGVVYRVPRAVCVQRRMLVRQVTGPVNVWKSTGEQWGQQVSTPLPWLSMPGQLDTLWTGTRKMLVSLPAVLSTILDWSRRRYWSGSQATLWIGTLVPYHWSILAFCNTVLLSFCFVLVFLSIFFVFLYAWCCMFACFICVALFFGCVLL